MTSLRRHAVPLFFGALTFLMMGPMLVPGYLLTLDMPWTPTVPLVWSTQGFNNSLLVYALLHALSWTMPSWLVQKCLLTAIVFLLFYIPWRWLPLIPPGAARVGAAMLYALNPFVYARMLAGQWTILLAYALLPLAMHALLKLIETPNKRTALRCAAALALLSLGAIHYTYLLLLVMLLLVSIYAGVHVGNKKYRAAAHVAGWAGVGIVLFALASTYWLVPALLRTAPREQAFDMADATTFAAAQNERTPATLNVLGLGGFWGEQQAWRYYFLWPQDTRLFWSAAFLIALIMLYGLCAGVRDPQLRRGTLMMLGLGIIAYVTALGAAQTPLYASNAWLYQHLPGWNGLRDSHKIAAFLSLAYAVLFGIGISHLLGRMRKKIYVTLCIALTLLLPIVTGMYQWWGWHHQLQPVWYPQGWYDVQAALAQTPTQEKVLVLPWHQYLSLPFAHQLLVANPAPAFFGPDRIIASKDSEIGTVVPTYDDTTLRQLDALVQSAAQHPHDLPERLRGYGIGYLLVIAPPQTGTDDAQTIAAFTALTSKQERYGDLMLGTLKEGSK